MNIVLMHSLIFSLHAPGQLYKAIKMFTVL
jgi:hypothetical protein